MSNFYDLETDLDVEDVSEQQDYEDISEFAAFDAGDAESRWGQLDFTERVNELENYIATSKRYLFLSRKKRVINGEEVTHLMQYIQNKFPAEVTKAKNIIADRDAILANARQEEKEIVESAQNYYKTTTQSATEDADKIIKHAQEQAEEMVQAHAITQAARVRSEEIMKKCQDDANALMAQTLQDCEAHKKQARDWALGISQGSYNFVSDALGKYQNVAMSNLNEISEIYKQLQGGFESHMQSLQANPKVQGAQQPTAQPADEDEE